MQVSIYFTHHTLGHSYFTKENFLKYFPFHSTFLAQSPCNNLPWKGIGCAWSRAQKGSVSFFGRRNWFIWCEWKWIEWLLPPLRQIFVLNPAWLLPHTHPSSLLLSKGWDLQGITEIPSRKTPISFFPSPKKSCQGGGAQEQDTAPNQHHGVPPSLHPLWKNMIPAPSDGKAKETPCCCWLSQGEPALPSIPTQEFSFPQPTQGCWESTAPTLAVRVGAAQSVWDSACSELNSIPVHGVCTAASADIPMGTAIPGIWTALKALQDELQLCLWEGARKSHRILESFGWRDLKAHPHQNSTSAVLWVQNIHIHVPKLHF